MDTERADLPLATKSPAASCACCATGANATAESGATDSEITLLVEGMTCAHCVSSVTEELTELEGVESVSIDLVTGGTSTVRVITRSAVADASLTAAVNDAGYQVVER